MSQVVESNLTWQTRVIEEPLEISYQIARPHSRADIGGKYELQFFPLIRPFCFLGCQAALMRLKDVSKVLGQGKRAPAIFAFRRAFTDHTTEFLRLLGDYEL